MAMITECLKIDVGQAAQSLRKAHDLIAVADGELVLDFSNINRIDASVLTALELLAATAEARDLKVGLRGVNVDIYKVLKLMKLAQRFSFIT